MENYKLFFDVEMTSLKYDFNILSIGIVSQDMDAFYAEFTDYDLDKLGQWTKDNVLDNLIGHNDIEKYIGVSFKTTTRVLGDMNYVRLSLLEWLQQFNTEIEFWSDVLAFDWIALLKVIADYDNPDLYPIMPDNVFYIPFDISTMMRVKGVDPDINREKFVDLDDGYVKHNALWDAYVIKKCYEKLVTL